MDNRQHDEAIGHYSTALSIHPTNTPGYFMLRSKICMAKESWEDAIGEVTQVCHSYLLHVHSCRRSMHQAIALDPSSPWGYEMKRTALHQVGCYGDAIETFETMLSKMVQSSDPQIRGELYR